MAVIDLRTPRRDSGSAPATDAAQAKARVKQWVVAGATRAGVLADRADPVLLVTEINCPDPDCPGPETVVLLFRHAEETVEDAVKFKIKAPLRAVTEADVADALAALTPGHVPETRP